MRFGVPFSVCRLRCAVQGGRPSDDPASTFDPTLAQPPEVGRLREDLVLAVLSLLRALRPPCAAHAAENHGSRRSDRVMRRGLSFARRSATR